MKLSASRVASRHLEAGLRFRDLLDADEIHAGFRRLSQNHQSEWAAESALDKLLERHGLRNSSRKSSRMQGAQQWHLETMDGERIKEHLNVFHRPGMRPGWTAFQVSL